MSDKYQCRPQDAARIREWIATRGGILIWKSLNLSNPTGSWTTPALDSEGRPYGKPTWQAANVPSRHITSMDEVEVVEPKLVKRFHVGVRRADLSLKVTDAGSRRIRAAVEKAGDGAYYEFDYGQQDALIYVPARVVPLAEWNET